MSKLLRLQKTPIKKSSTSNIPPDYNRKSTELKAPERAMDDLSEPITIALYAVLFDPLYSVHYYGLTRSKLFVFYIHRTGYQICGNLRQSYALPNGSILRHTEYLYKNNKKARTVQTEPHGLCCPSTHPTQSP